MDQSALGGKYPIIHTPDLDISSESTGRQQPFLRSHSDTRLHIPHFLCVTDPGFHTHLPSLFENSTGFDAHQLGSHENMDSLNASGAERKLSLGKPGLDRNKSAFELCSANAHTEDPATLRKTSSVANYKNIEGSDSISRTGSSSLLSSAFHFVTGNNNASSTAIQKIPEEDEGGLRMMVGSNFSAGGLHDDHSLMHSTSAHLPSSGLADISTLTEKNKPKPGVLGGVFNRGFFAKPVLNDRENSYRYLLAADKF